MFVRQLLEAQERERRLLTAELLKVKGLMPLLMKRRNGGSWSMAERHELIEQLHAVAYLSPYLVVLALPGSFVVLPLLAWWLDRRRRRRDQLLPAPLPARQGSERRDAAVRDPDRRT